MRITEVKKKVIVMGWTQNMIVEATGRSKTEVSMVLNGYRFTPSVQKDISRVVGIPVGELFGEWAWFNRQRTAGGGDSKHA